jgi:HSP20 family protein
MLARWDPFHEITDPFESLDRFFNNRFWGGQQWGESMFPLDVVETDEGYTVKASLPGLKPEDLDITFNNNVLTIKGEVKQDQEVDQSRYYLQERRYGQFQRSLTLPGKFDADEIKANYEAGVLTLFLPKSEEVRPKRIQIQSGAQSKMIDGREVKK